MKECFTERLPRGSFVHNLLSKVEKYVSNGMPFFPEYTCHDMKHVYATLDLALNLIPGEMFDSLEPEAIELLVAAILLHDLGMFIQKDGLEQLILGAGKDTAIDHIDIDLASSEKLTWGIVWEKYYREVRRYPQQRIDSEFGLDANSEKINILLLQSDKVDMNYAKVYGGFLRRYHPRLAHDIVMNGFIGTNGARNNILSDAKDYQRKLIGIIARSHGMNLRDTEAFLGREFSNRPESPHGIPIYYLMAILRMADYLHAGEERVPNAQAVITPSSLHEITWNQAVYDKMHFDFESRQMYVDTKPENSKVFLALEKWLSDVQRELDLCWAVLDEKYRGKYKLSIHRIVADVFNETKKNEWRKSFLPRKAQLSANPEIVKLMVAPLYGNNSSYGVRELLQNAIDACNERKEIENARGCEYIGKITVEIDTENRKFTITDNGIGMDEDVLINYYLTVGASYRHSASWAVQYMDDDGKSRVVRSGRFGVGVMAAFLFGESVSVTTRHHKDDRGYCFSFNTESELLNIERTEEGAIKVGTVITISLTEDLDFYRAFGGWTNWYHMSQPLVTYILDGIKQSTREIQYIDNGDWNWFHFESALFDSVKWTFTNSYEELFCNGIKIETPLFANEGFGRRSIDPANYGLSITPTISICDKNGELDLSLNREYVKSFPEAKKLLSNMYSQRLAYILARRERYECEDEYDKDFFVFRKHGFTLDQATFLSYAKYDKMFLVFHNISTHANDRIVQNMEVQNHEISDVFYILKKIAGVSGFSDFDFFHGVVNIWYKGSFALKSLLDTLFDDSMSLAVQEHYSLGDGTWHFSPKRGGLKLSVPDGLKIDDDIPLIVECYRRYDQRIPDEQNIMLQVLRRYLPHQGEDWDGWIPLELEDRVKRYPNAFVELFKYMPPNSQADIRKLLTDMNLTPLEE